MKHEEYLFEISENITKIFGLHFQSNQFHDLERRLKAAAKELNIDVSISNINDWLSKTTLTSIELNTIASHLTIGETYFFREKPSLELFQQIIIPELIKQRRNQNEEIRIWSAGCSSGEEPYTLAIILKEFFPQLADWKVTILATDISPIAIQKALHGEYTDWSFRDSDNRLKNKYFTDHGKNWRINSEIKKMVTFSYLNLSKNSYPSMLTNTDNFDVIFCRNVMMYFTPEVIKEVSGRFYNSIIENGWLITSQVELNDEYFSNFERVNYNNGIFYQKTNKKKVQTKTPLINLSNIIHNTTIQKEENKIAIRRSVENVAKKVPMASKPLEKKETEALYPGIFYQSGNYQNCIEGCLRIIEKGRLDKEIFDLLVKSFANSGQLAEGENTIHKILLNHSATAEMFYIYASFLKEQNNLHLSEVILKKAVYLNHGHILSNLMLGDINLHNGKKHIAIKHYKTVIGLLEKYNDNELVPESDGMTAGRIKALAESKAYNL